LLQIFDSLIQIAYNEKINTNEQNLTEQKRRLMSLAVSDKMAKYPKTSNFGCEKFVAKQKGDIQRTNKNALHVTRFNKVHETKNPHSTKPQQACSDAMVFRTTSAQNAGTLVQQQSSSSSLLPTNSNISDTFVTLEF